MDDLISRKALREAMYHEAFEMDSDMQKWDSGCWIRYKIFENHLKDAPSVPAVPLDKLCEWLADNYEPPANVSNGKALDDHEFCVTLWRYVLEKMMEEQDAN